MLQNHIRRSQKELEGLDSNNLENFERIEELTNAIKQMTYKLEQSIKFQNNPRQIVTNKPEYGDGRYMLSSNKEGLDMLRVLYYDFFKKDPSLSFITSDSSMFTDNTLPIEVNTYLIRGIFQFKIMFEGFYKDYIANNNHSIGIKISKEQLMKKGNNKYFKLLNDLIKLYTNCDINFICSDSLLKDYTISYISDKNFVYSGNLQEKRYYDFFELLCDNNLRNIIYIGETFKSNVSLEELKRVNNKFVHFHQELIAKQLGISYEKLLDDNNNIKKLILNI